MCSHFGPHNNWGGPIASSLPIIVFPHPLNLLITLFSPQHLMLSEIIMHTLVLSLLSPIKMQAPENRFAFLSAVLPVPRWSRCLTDICWMGGWTNALRRKGRVAGQRCFTSCAEFGNTGICVLCTINPSPLWRTRLGVLEVALCFKFLSYRKGEILVVLGQEALIVDFISYLLMYIKLSQI